MAGAAMVLGATHLLIASTCVRHAPPVPPPQPQIEEPDLFEDLEHAVLQMQLAPDAEESDELAYSLYQNYSENRSPLESRLLFISHLSNRPEWLHSFCEQRGEGPMLLRTALYLTEMGFGGDGWRESAQANTDLVRSIDYEQHPEWVPVIWRLVNLWLLEFKKYWQTLEPIGDHQDWIRALTDLLAASQPLMAVYSTQRPIALLRCLTAWGKTTTTHAPWAAPLFRQSMTHILETQPRTAAVIQGYAPLMQLLQDETGCS